MAISRIPAITQITKEFTSSGTWTCPSGVYSAEFLVVGAGGAGGGVGASVNTRYHAGGGGGGGAVKRVNLPVTPGSAYTITIGAKGTGVSAAAGNNGGFSEVLLSGSTLIRANGGGGGRGVTTADAGSVPADTGTKSSTGGVQVAATVDTQSAGGGGGAFPAKMVADAVILFTQNQPTEGSYGKTNTSAANNQFAAGSAGIDGFGFGGGGGVSGSGFTSESGVTGYGAGAGIRQSTSGATAGNNASVAGCGGGGAASMTSTTSVAGGNGADGLVRITYLG